jgi:AcrR family transcriptional regulator
MEYPLVDIKETKNNRDRILLIATRMFSNLGYAEVSIRDIAAEVGIKPASIYNHFESKEALLEEIIEEIKKVYLDYYTRLDKHIEKSNCFEDVLKSLFVELREVYHMYIHYGIILLSTAQFWNNKAKIVFNDIYMKKGIDYSDNIFKECIKRKWVEEFDTRMLATLFMNDVFVGSLLRVEEDMKIKTVYNVTDMYESLYRYILSSVKVIK